MKTHGGLRQGAGRKKGEPTKTVRVPDSLVDAVQALIRLHKNGDNHIDMATVCAALHTAIDTSGFDSAKEVRNGRVEMERQADTFDSRGLWDDADKLREKIDTLLN